MNVTLRHWQRTDLQDLVRYASNEKVAANLRDSFPYPYTEDHGRNFILACVLDDEEESFYRAIVVDGHAVGSISVTRGSDVHFRTAELGYWLGEPYWGRGIMTEAVGLICKEAFANWPDLVRIFAETFAANTGSCRALEKAGFEREAVLKHGACKQGMLQDTCIYALLRNR